MSMPWISPNIVILTRDEYQHKLDAAFQRGVKRGKFEAGCVARDRDRSGEADETAKQAQPEARARAEGIAQTPPGDPT